MNTAEVRKIVEEHGQKVVAGKMDRVLSDFTERGKATAPPVVAELPNPVTSADVVGLEQQGSQYIADIRYGGKEKATTVRSTWEDDGGALKIVDVRVVS